MFILSYLTFVQSNERLITGTRNYFAKARSIALWSPKYFDIPFLVELDS
jgi:hypothetical protein